MGWIYQSQSKSLEDLITRRNRLRSRCGDLLRHPTLVPSHTDKDNIWSYQMAEVEARTIAAMQLELDDEVVRIKSKSSG